MLLQENFLRLTEEGRPDEDARGSTPEFLTRCLLGAREEAGEPSNGQEFDEDVNVYIVGLLQRFLSPGFHEEAARWIRLSDLDLAREARRSGDDRHQFDLYRTNADHLLVAIGIFRHVPGTSHPGAPLAHREPEEFIGRGSIYYQLASSCLRRLCRRATGPELAMRKLGSHFGRYVDILHRLRHSYFHLTGRIGDGTLYHLMREGEPASLDRTALYDAFLDAFSAWKREPGPERHAELAEAVRRLRDHDPDFAFQMPEDGA